MHQEKNASISSSPAIIVTSHLEYSIRYFLNFSQNEIDRFRPIRFKFHVTIFVSDRQILVNVEKDRNKSDVPTLILSLLFQTI